MGCIAPDRRPQRPAGVRARQVERVEEAAQPRPAAGRRPPPGPPAAGARCGPARRPARASPAGARPGPGAARPRPPGGGSGRAATRRPRAARARSAPARRRSRSGGAPPRRRSARPPGCGRAGCRRPAPRETSQAQLGAQLEASSRADQRRRRSPERPSCSSVASRSQRPDWSACHHSARSRSREVIRSRSSTRRGTSSGSARRRSGCTSRAVAQARHSGWSAPSCRRRATRPLSAHQGTAASGSIPTGDEVDAARPRSRRRRRLDPLLHERDRQQRGVGRRASRRRPARRRSGPGRRPG